jgi:segregation and condensation protein B
MSMNTDYPCDNGASRGQGSPGIDTNGTDGTDNQTVANPQPLNGHSPHPGDLHPAGAEELKPILEALLFVSHEPVTLERLTAALGMVSKAEVRQTLGQLQAEYEKAERGLQVSEIAGGFQMTTRPEYAPWIKSLGKTKGAPKLSRSGLESLAIIAYRQPIVRAEIEAIRGVETSGVLRTLLERKLVRIVGRKDVPGRPIMYGTTKYFLQHFGLSELGELPPLREFTELGESEQVALPVGDTPMDMSVEHAQVESENDTSSLATLSAAADDDE